VEQFTILPILVR